MLRPLLCRYYKKFAIPDMQRCGLLLEQEAVAVAHANNTLIITVSWWAWCAVGLSIADTTRTKLYVLHAEESR